MLANSRCIECEVLTHCPPICAIIVSADPGTSIYITNIALQISQNGGYLILSITPVITDDDVLKHKFILDFDISYLFIHHCMLDH